MNKVVVIGSAVADVILKSKDLKVMKSHEMSGGMAMCEVLGGKIEAEQGLLEVGGGGTNVAVGMRRLGEAVRVVCRVGDDALASLICTQMEKEGVDLTMVQKGNGKTGLSSVLVAQDGRRSAVTFRGESGEIQGDKIDWDEMKKADWVQVSSLGGEIDLLEDLVSFCLEHGIRIGLNPGKSELRERERMERLIPKIDFLNMNRMEASDFWKSDFENELEIVRKFVGIGTKMMAITNGARGAGVYWGGKWIKMDAFPNPSVDDTGAGDAFVSGFVCGVLQNQKIETCLKMGLANGASVVGSLGAKEGLLFEREMTKWVGRKRKMIEQKVVVL